MTAGNHDGPEVVADGSAHSIARLGEFVKLPGLFRPKEIGPALVPGSSLRLEAQGSAEDGTPLFAIYSRAVIWDPADGGAAAAVRCAPDGGANADTPRATSMLRAARAHLLVAPPGRANSARANAKARHQEEHLCFKCAHYAVCGMAKGLDPVLLVTITHCLGFEPTDEEDDAIVSELVTIPPLGAP